LRKCECVRERDREGIGDLKYPQIGVYTLFIYYGRRGEEAYRTCKKDDEEKGKIKKGLKSE